MVLCCLDNSNENRDIMSTTYTKSRAIKCIQCGHQLPATAKFCRNCGVSLVEPSNKEQPQAPEHTEEHPISPPPLTPMLGFSSVMPILSKTSASPSASWSIGDSK